MFRICVQILNIEFEQRTTSDTYNVLYTEHFDKLGFGVSGKSHINGAYMKILHTYTQTHGLYRDIHTGDASSSGKGERQRDRLWTEPWDNDGMVGRGGALHHGMSKWLRGWHGPVLM